MMLPSSLLLSVFLLTSSATAQYDDGMWHAEGGSGSGATAKVATAAQATEMATGTAVAAGYGTATAAAGTAATGAAGEVEASAGSGGDWQQAVTWPAGCETWANPCPAGAKIQGGGVATAAPTGTAAAGTGKYENGFTSFTTETDSNGVITGMPTKATLAAGVSSGAAAQTTMLTAVSGSESSAETESAAASNGTGVVTPTGPRSSRTASGFSVESSTPASSNGAGGKFAGSALAMLVAAGVAALAL